MRKLIILLLISIPLSSGEATHSCKDNELIEMILQDNPDFYNWDAKTRKTVKELYKNPYQ